MSATAAALLGYVAWTMLMVMSLGVYRTVLVMAAGRAANSFGAAGDDLEGLGKRLTRAHANCYENLPVAGAVLLYAIAAGQTSVTDELAYILIGARVAQSVTHLLSTSNFFVLIRFAFFGVQLAILIYWLLQLSGLA